MSAYDRKALTPSITRRQREVLDHLSAKGAFSRVEASMVYGADSNVADKLAANGVINKRYGAHGDEVYWIRAEGEPATGVSILTGFSVVLHREVTTPSGRSENFFLARAPYDGKGATFRQLLRGWMSMLKLKPKDLLASSFGIEVVPADSPMFDGDHLILDAIEEKQS
jgi:hypothetical protein